MMRRWFLILALALTAVLLVPSAAGALTTGQKIARLQKAVASLQKQVKVLTAQVEAKHAILNGTGAPAAGLGEVGDFYMDTSSHTVYGPKTLVGWGTLTSLIGPKGDAGSVGPQGPVGPVGPRGPVGVVGFTERHTIMMQEWSEVVTVPGFGILRADAGRDPADEFSGTVCFRNPGFSNTSGQEVTLRLNGNETYVVPAGDVVQLGKGAGYLMDVQFELLLTRGSSFAHIYANSTLTGNNVTGSLDFMAHGIIVD